ncbi:MAG TPA: hypothetical protein VD969_27050 [Symbiobacteriaceae bacterium]|nr:hypothetical protein [Symbiobacteriaceae bacterium]
MEEQRLMAASGWPKFLGEVRVSDLPKVSSVPGTRKAVPLRSPDKAAVAEIARDEVTIMAPPPVGTTPNPPPLLFNMGWQGLSFAQASGAPPDVSIAVGPNHIVETINTAMAIYDKNGLMVSGPISLDTFFTTAPFFTFDPKVMFDSESGRFFLVLIGIDEVANVGRCGRSHCLNQSGSH